MPSDSLSAIVFDEQDANLFQVDDARLRADALKHSVLPRLRVVLNEAIAQIREVYGIEALEDSIVSQSPNFRTKRKDELRFVYDSISVGLAGQRKLKWPAFLRKNGKPVQIIPFDFYFRMDEEGLLLFLDNRCGTTLAKESCERLWRFNIESETSLNALCLVSGMRSNKLLSDVISPLSNEFRFYIEEGCRDDHCFFGHNYHFPVQEPQLRELIWSFVDFFPLYDSYIQMAKGCPTRLNELSAVLNRRYEAELRGEIEERDLKTTDSAQLSEQAAALAQQKVRVMPALRWQVFQRDGWKCVACGKGAHDDVILHVDHIQPRSLGGSDSLGNFQTLCDQCNLGKSNRDNTDLRKGSHGLDH